MLRTRHSAPGAALFLLGLAAAIASTAPARKPSARQLKPRFLANIELSLQGGMTDLASDTYGHLLELCMDEAGEPNARVTCTAGYGHALEYVTTAMSDLGLVPLGNAERTSFQQTVEGSVDETFCPPGITNVIGMIEGTELPEEYVVYTAHLDGPNNENPQTVVTRGNAGVSNAYDDALAVAVGLALAKQFVLDPPRRSVVILISDGEEGWSNVGEVPPGLSPDENFNRLSSTSWYSAVRELTGGSFIGMSYW